MDWSYDRGLLVRMVVSMALLFLSGLIGIGFTFLCVFIFIAVCGEGTLSFSLTLGVSFLVWLFIVSVAFRRYDDQIAEIVRPQQQMEIKAVAEPPPDVLWTVERLSQQLDIPVPTVVIAAMETPTAMTTGYTPRSARIILSESLLHVIDDAQLTAVLAHECSHIKHRDTGVLTVATIPERFWEALVDLSQTDSNKGKELSLGQIAEYGTRLFSRLLTRDRELAADRGAVALMGSIGPLAGAIRTLEEEHREDLRTVTDTMASFSFLPPERDTTPEIMLGPDGNRPPTSLRTEYPRAAKYYDWLLRTHPDPDERIERLQKLEQSSLE